MAKPRTASTSKPRLGRGLSSLILNSSRSAGDDGSYVPADQPSARAPSADSSESRAGRPEHQEIRVDQIAPNPYQPRRDFRAEELAELAASISRQGLLQPLLVCPSLAGTADRPYVLVAGERRLRAARQAGLTTVPCQVKQASGQQMLEWALVENIQRSDLNPIEKARGYREYLDRFGLTQAEVAERLSQPRATVANYLRLLALHDDTQRLLADGKLSFGHGKVLAGLTGRGELERNLAKKAAKRGLSVRQLERLAGKGGKAATGGAGRSAGPKAAYLSDLEERLSERLGTRVRIVPGRKKHSGKVVIEYYSLDDFDRVAGALGLETDV